MSPGHFRIVKHVTAAVFALVMAGLFVLGTDGLISGMQRLTRIYVTPPRPPPASAPAAGPVVVPAFIVPSAAAPPEPAAAP